MNSNDKRARQKANRAARLAAEHAEEIRRRRVRRLTTWTVLAGVVVALFVLARVLGGDDGTDTATPAPTTSAVPAASTTSLPATGVSAPAPGASLESDTPCPAVDGSSERVTSFASAPPMCIDESATYTAVVDSSYGTFTIALDAAAAPQTVNNFVVLARYHYYDGAPFHRIIPGFVIQGGDAVGNPLGTGNPGYAIPDELPEAGAYQVGSVAMANSGPDTNGSQFFVVTGPNGAALPPQYSLFGTVTDGLDVVQAIEGAETTVGDAPVDTILINSVTIQES